jgi:hypothetical protein
MKKLLYLMVILLIYSCAGDASGNATGNEEFPPDSVFFKKKENKPMGKPESNQRIDDILDDEYPTFDEVEGF